MKIRKKINVNTVHLARVDIANKQVTEVFDVVSDSVSTMALAKLCKLYSTKFSVCCVLGITIEKVICTMPRDDFYRLCDKEAID